MSLSLRSSAFQSAVQITGSLKARAATGRCRSTPFQSAVQITGSLKLGYVPLVEVFHLKFQSAVQITGSLK